MSRFAYALKQDLYAAQDLFDSENEFDLSAVMGNLTSVIEASEKALRGETLTPAEELQYFRAELNRHLDWQASSIGFGSKDSARARKIVNDLTETSHLL